MPYLALAARWLLALFLGVAAVGKLINLRQFRAVVQGWGMLPSEGTVLTVTLGLPAVELALAILLATAVSWLWPPLAALALFFAFAGVAVTNIARGRAGKPCGCFGAGGVISWGLVGRNCALAGLAAAALGGRVAAVGGTAILTWVVAGAVTRLRRRPAAPSHRRVGTAPRVT